MRSRSAVIYAILLITCVVVLSIAPLTALTAPLSGTPTAALPLPALDADCVRFLDPSAVVNGEIVYTSFSRYVPAVAHAVAAWSPALGFSIPLRNAPPADATIPAQSTLIVRDASVPTTIFKGVTVTWTNAPATITLNTATLPPPGTSSATDNTTLLAVMTHEFGHALGLGDVPPPGVTIRECANMLMKRSVDRGGGPMTVPQPADIALYCLRWGGPICGDDQQPGGDLAASPDPNPTLPASPGADAVSRIPYYFAVIACAARPDAGITSDDVLANDLPAGCVRAPAGVLFNVAIDGGPSYSMLTNGQGEFAVLLPEDGSAEVSLPRSGDELFPSLVGFRPVVPNLAISTTDPACTALPSLDCHTVFVLYSGGE